MKPPKEDILLLVLRCINERAHHPATIDRELEMDDEAAHDSLPDDDETGEPEEETDPSANWLECFRLLEDAVKQFCTFSDTRRCARFAGYFLVWFDVHGRLYELRHHLESGPASAVERWTCFLELIERQVSEARTCYIDVASLLRACLNGTDEHAFKLFRAQFGGVIYNAAHRRLQNEAPLLAGRAADVVEWFPAWILLKKTVRKGKPKFETMLDAVSKFVAGHPNADPVELLNYADGYLGKIVRTSALDDYLDTEIIANQVDLPIENQPDANDDDDTGPLPDPSQPCDEPCDPRVDLLNKIIAGLPSDHRIALVLSNPDLFNAFGLDPADYALLAANTGRQPEHIEAEILDILCRSGKRKKPIPRHLIAKYLGKTDQAAYKAISRVNLEFKLQIAQLSPQ